MMDVKSELFEPHIAEIKQELIACEESKLEQRSDLLMIIEQDYVRESEYLQYVPIDIKKEHKEDLNDIKQEPFEFVQPKSESELLTLLNTHCDLPTLKDENTAHPSYLDQSNNNKQAERKSKLLKNALIDVSKKKRRMFPCPVGQNTFRSTREKLFNVQFGIRCYEICYYCGQFFLTKSQFRSHFIIHCVKKVTKFCIRKFEQYKYCRCKNCLHTMFHSNETLLQCEICPKIFSTERNLNDHLKIHKGRNLFKCEICLKQFSRKGDLKTHLQIHTVVEKQFKCEICLKQFSRKGVLKNHLKTHTVEKSFECEICSKQFSRKGDLKTHLQIHTLEKPFKCKICLKHFAQKTNFELHLKVHTGKKPFKCDICLKQFFRKGDLKTHLNIHTGEKLFECEICSKPFFRKGDLKTHLNVHTGEKPFKCAICSKYFSQKVNLETHLKIHNGVKPFKCEICLKQFTRKESLNTHLQIHIRENLPRCE